MTLAEHVVESLGGELVVREERAGRLLTLRFPPMDVAALPLQLETHGSASLFLGLRLVQILTRPLRGSVELDRSHGTCFTVRFRLRHGALTAPRDRGPTPVSSADDQAVV